MTATDARAPAAAAGRTRRVPAASYKNRPAFVSKLWTMVNDTKNQEYIRWMPDGQSIQVVNREAFEKNILPKHFKHSNFSSFVRQLNMYGWHKVQDVNSGSMHSNDEHWQFQSPNFVKGREDLLDNIVRNKGKHNEDDEEQQAELSKLLSELEQIKSRQITIGEDLSRIREDNELLWNEYYNTREVYEKHSNMLDRIVRFLANVYGADNKMLDMVGNHVPLNHRLLMASGQNGASVYPPSAASNTSPQIQQLQELQDMQNRIQHSGSSTSRTSPAPSVETPPSAEMSKALIPSTRSRSSAGLPVRPSGSPAGIDGLIKAPPPGLSTANLPPLDLGNGALPTDLRRPSSSRLEELEADLANQGNSLKEVQELIQRISPSFGLSDPDMDPNFNVDDFLVHSPVDAATGAANTHADHQDPLAEGIKLEDPIGFDADADLSPPSKKAKHG